MSIIFTLFQAPFSDFGIQETFSVSDVWRKHLNLLKLPPSLRILLSHSKKSQQIQPINRSHKLKQLSQACSRRWREDWWGSSLLLLCTVNHLVVCHRAGKRGFYAAAALLSLIFIRVTKMVLEDSEDGWDTNTNQTILFSYPANCWLEGNNSWAFVSVSKICNLLFEQKISLGLIYSSECPQTPLYLKDNLWSYWPRTAAGFLTTTQQPQCGCFCNHLSLIAQTVLWEHPVTSDFVYEALLKTGKT